MNETLVKFGHPATLIRDYRHWCVLLRPAQATLGALVLGARSEFRAFASLPADAFAELATIIADIEAALGRFRPFERINYLMLMMVDPHVHFHVLPRYGTPQTFEGESFTDAGWPGPPDLKSAGPVSTSLRDALVAAIKSHWRAD